jgi:APA family basic amino acid/polyamine antiporter
MVAMLVGGLLTFVVIGVLGIETGNYSPLFPADGDGAPFADGYSPLLIAIVTLYIPFQGFGMVVEIGEELKNPIKNIPRVLAIGMGIVVAISLGVVVVLAGVMPWQRAEAVIGDGGGLAAVAETFTSSEVAAVIAIAALIGAATTINTLFTSYSRTIMRAGRDDVVPSSFAAVHEEYGTPTRAILALGVPPILLAPAAIYANAVFAVDMLDWLVTVTVTGIFVAFALLGIGLWRLPKIFPQRYEHSFYRLPKPLLKVVAVGNTVVSIIFGVFVVLSQPSAFLVVLGWIAVATVVHRYRVWRYQKKGVDLTERMSSLHSHE